MHGANLFKVFMMFYLNAVIFFKENKLGLESIAGMLIQKTLGEGGVIFCLFSTERLLKHTCSMYTSLYNE